MAKEPEVYVGKEGAQELYRRIRAEIGKFTAFQKAEPAADGTPDIALPDRKTNIIYLVPVSGSPDPDHYMEWIWTAPEAAEPAWVCIGDTSSDTPKYVDVTGTVSGTTQTVDLTHNRFARISIDSDATELVINVPAEEADRVGWFRFDFTLPEDTVMERVRVLDSTGTETLLFVPMRYPGPVTYKGEVVDSLAKIIGYPDPSYVDPLNPLGLPDYTIRVKFDTTDEPTFANGEATLVESSRGGWSIWDLTYESSDWNGLLRGQSHLAEVLGANTSHVTDMTSLFNSCGNLEAIAIFDTSRVENMCGTFGYCPKLESIPAFDLTNVSNMSYAFAGCSKLKSFTGFNLPNLRSATSMFNYCSSLEDTSFDSSRLTNFDYMFQGCTSLAHGPDISTASAQTMRCMFDRCTALEDIPAYDVRKVTNFYEMFYGCSALVDVPALSTNSALNMELMFCNCTSLGSMPSLNTATVTNMKSMFSGCQALTATRAYNTASLQECEYMFANSGIRDIPEMDFSNIKVLNGLFNSCTGLTALPEMNLAKAKSINYMFAYCSNITNVPNMVIPSVTKADSVFEQCVNVESGALDAYVIMLSTDIITEHSNTFKNCGVNTETGLADLNMIMTTWGGLLDIPLNSIRLKYAPGTTPSPSLSTCSSRQIDVENNIWEIKNYSSSWYNGFYGDTNITEVVGANLITATSMQKTFMNCSNLETVCDLCIPKVNSFTDTFVSCSSLKTAGRLKTSNALLYTRYMFSGCSSLKTVEEINTSSATNMDDMFISCVSLEHTPKGLDTSSATTTSAMFWGCKVLEDVPAFDLSNCTDATYMFNNCNAVKSITLTGCSNIDNAHHMFNKCTSLEELSIDQMRPTEAYGMFIECNLLTEVPNVDFSQCQSLYQAFENCKSITDVSINAASATTIERIFKGCESLETVTLSNTSNVTNMSQAFMDCTALTALPTINTSSATNVSSIFAGCENVESGMLAVYTSMSTQSVPPTIYSGAFFNCGTNTETGREELDSIPVKWGGNGGDYIELINMRDVVDHITLNRNIGRATILVNGEARCTDYTGSSYSFDVPANAVVRIIGAKYNDPYNGNNTGGSWQSTSGLITKYGSDDNYSSQFKLTRMDPNVLYKPNYAPNLFVRSPIAEIASLDMINVENILGIFCMSNITKIPNVGSLSNVKYVSNAFASAKSLKEFPSFRVFSAITNTNSMFANSGIERIDSFEGLETVTNASSMFASSAIKTLPRNFKGLENVTNINSMFLGCNNLTSLDISFEYLAQNTSSIYANNVFSDCKGLTRVNLDDKFTAFINRTSSIRGFLCLCPQLENAYEVYQAFSASNYGANGGYYTQNSLSYCSYADNMYDNIPANYATHSTSYYVTIQYTFYNVDDTFKPFITTGSGPYGFWNKIGTNQWTYTAYNSGPNSGMHDAKPSLPTDYHFAPYTDMTYKIENMTGNLYVEAAYWNLRSHCEELSDSACEYLYTYMSHFNNGHSDISFSGSPVLKKVPKLRYRPDYITSSGTTIDVDSAFDRCVNVESGALDLYNYMKDAGFKSHSRTFRDCGINTVSGSAELEQIPTGWK